MAPLPILLDVPVLCRAVPTALPASCMRGSLGILRAGRDGSGPCCFGKWDVQGRCLLKNLLQPETNRTQLATALLRLCCAGL